MREAEKDQFRLQHIIEAIDNLLVMTKDIDLENLSSKDLRFFGVVKLLEIIGEAAYMLTNEFREEHKMTPWNDIIKMRHILVHGYYVIDPYYINYTVKENLSPLKSQVIGYLSEFK